MGCHSMPEPVRALLSGKIGTDEQLTSLVCPFSASSSRNVRMSKSRTIPSPPAVATRWPSGPHLLVLTVDLCECLFYTSAPIAAPDQSTNNVLRSLPVRGSQNLTSMSLLPLTTSPFVGCQSTHRTSQPCPLHQPCPFKTSHLIISALLLPRGNSRSSPGRRLLL